jgi:hypothetical protein
MGSGVDEKANGLVDLGRETEMTRYGGLELGVL